MEISRVFKSLIFKSGLSLKKFSEVIELPPEDTLNWWVGDEVHLDYCHLKKFESYFGFKDEDIINETVDIGLLRKRIHTLPVALPKKYGLAAYSFVRSSAHIVKYLRLLYGQEYVDELLMSLQIHPCYFDNLNNRININFFIDLLSLCKKLGFKNDHFLKLASSLFLSVENTKLEKLFYDRNCYEEAYYTINDSTKFFDDNFEYKFHIAPQGMELISRPNDVVGKLISEKGEDASLLYLYRSLVFGAMPLLCGLPYLQLSVKSCLSRGDSFCRYIVRFPRSTIRVINNTF